MPDEVADFWLDELTGAEVKVLVYILRRTLGFYKRQDAISYTQFLEGIRKKNGERLDHGAGVSRGALYAALKRLEQLGLIVATRRPLSNLDNEVTLYSVAWVDSPAPTPHSEIERDQLNQPHSVFEQNPVQNLNQQDTVQDTDQQEDPGLASIAKTAAVAINQYPRRADVARQLGRIISATGATPSELARAVDRAVKRQTPGRSPDDFYQEVRLLLEIRT